MKIYDTFYHAPKPAGIEKRKAYIAGGGIAGLSATAFWSMPPELRKAHQNNDRTVMDAYGFVKDTEARTSESACVAELMRPYQKKAVNSTK